MAVLLRRCIAHTDCGWAFLPAAGALFSADACTFRVRQGLLAASWQSNVVIKGEAHTSKKTGLSWLANISPADVMCASVCCAAR